MIHRVRILVGLMGPIFLCCSALAWLKTGNWLPIENAALLAAYMASPPVWLGLQKIVLFVLGHVPLGLVSLPLLIRAWLMLAEAEFHRALQERDPISRRATHL